MGIKQWNMHTQIEFQYTFPYFHIYDTMTSMAFWSCNCPGASENPWKKVGELIPPEMGLWTKSNQFKHIVVHLSCGNLNHYYNPDAH